MNNQNVDMKQQIEDLQQTLLKFSSMKVKEKEIQDARDQWESRSGRIRLRPYYVMTPFFLRGPHYSYNFFQFLCGTQLFLKKV